MSAAERRRFDVLRTIEKGTGDHWSVIYRTEYPNHPQNHPPSAWGVYRSQVCNLATAHRIANALNEMEEP